MISWDGFCTFFEGWCVWLLGRRGARGNVGWEQHGLEQRLWEQHEARRRPYDDDNKRELDRNIEQQRDRIRGEQIIKDSGRDRACVRVRACTRMRREMCVAVVRRYCFGRREYKFKSQVRERRTVNGQRPGALPRQYRREERSRARAACTHHPQHYSSVSSRRCSLPVSRAAAAAAARPALAAAAG